MALHSIAAASALPIALSIIPSLPRPVLSRLVARMIDRLDELDDDADLEDTDEDRCLAGDDGVFSGPAVHEALGFHEGHDWYRAGMDEDMEVESWPEFDSREAA